VPGRSLWQDTVEDAIDNTGPRAPLPGSASYDVAIVGGGFTGLWTAYYLALADPALKVAVLEAEVAGFGASGRNGGWCSALFPTPWSTLVRDSSAADALRLHRAMADTVVEVGRVAEAEGIDAHYARGGTVTLARSPAQLTRLREDIAVARERGFREDDLRLLSADEARERLEATEVVGGVFTPHCAAIHPARLVRGLARAVEARGVAIFEGTPVREIRPRLALTDAGTVSADVVVRATEGYTAGLAGARRTIAPVYSLMVATEPLPDSVWDTIGLGGRPTFKIGRASCRERV
jgi:glycine/D-amino acid oxidase-like deaminating enzyme